MVKHRNNIGFIRLILASCVIVGHAPEMMDGNASREPVAQFLPSMTLGGVAVGGFFLLSGYLITISMLRARSPLHFMERRMLRIYPAFIVAFLASVFVLGPMVGANPFERLSEAIVRIILLHKPGNYTGAFPGLVHHPMLNGAMWTIMYEFQCYLIIMLFGMIGLLGRRRFMLGVTAIMAAAFLYTEFHPVDAWPIGGGGAGIVTFLIGQPEQVVRLTTIFLIGSCFALYRDEIVPRLTGRVAAMCGIAAVALATADTRTAELALVTIGAVSLFWIALRASLGPLQRINDRWDISYGVYLYGWPIATYIRWVYPGIDPWTLAAVTLALAVIAGTASWHLIEKPTKDLRLFDRIVPRAIPLRAGA